MKASAHSKHPFGHIPCVLVCMYVRGGEVCLDSAWKTTRLYHHKTPRRRRQKNGRGNGGFKIYLPGVGFQGEWRDFFRKIQGCHFFRNNQGGEFDQFFFGREKRPRQIHFVSPDELVQDLDSHIRSDLFYYPHLKHTKIDNYTLKKSPFSIQNYYTKNQHFQKNK